MLGTLIVLVIKLYRHGGHISRKGVVDAFTPDPMRVLTFGCVFVGLVFQFSRITAEKDAWERLAHCGLFCVYLAVFLTGQWGYFTGRLLFGGMLAAALATFA